MIEPLVYGAMVLAALGLTIWSRYRPAALMAGILAASYVISNIVHEVGGHDAMAVAYPVMDTVILVIASFMLTRVTDLWLFVVFALHVVMIVSHAAMQAAWVTTEISLYNYHLTLNILFALSLVATCSAKGVRDGIRGAVRGGRRPDRRSNTGEARD